MEDGRFTRTLEVCGRDLTVGAAEGCGLRLVADGVAKRHARLRQSGRRVLIEDLGAKEGVEVGGRRVARATLAVGQQVRLGGARLVVESIRPATAEERVPRVVRSKLARRATPIAVSVAVHATLLLALSTWVLFEGRPRDDVAHVAIAAPVAPIDLAPPDETPPEFSDPLEVVPRETADVELLPVEQELPPEPVAQEDPRLKPPAPEPVETPPETPPEPAPVPIGVGASLPAEVVGRSFGKGEAAHANRVAAGLLETDAGGGAALRAARGAATDTNVWVIHGDYDSAETVLKQLGIAHAVIGKDALETSEIPATVRVVFYNCTGRALSPDTQRRIAWWVHEGGALVSTDWGVERLLEKGIPGTLTPLRVGERPVLTKDETVGVRPTTHRGLAAGLESSDVPARWWLEDSSVPFTIAQGIGAEVLVRSDELARRHGADASAVAVAFPYGKGRVLHMLGHVYQQEGNVRGAVIVQRLVVNFVASSLGR